MTGQTCPNCGGLLDSRPPAPGPGATPVCGCAAAGAGAAPAGAGTGGNAAGDTGGKPGVAAEVAAAEDFDPLRIRPYVTLPNSEEEGAKRGEGATAGGAVVAGGAVADGAEAPLAGSTGDTDSGGGTEDTGAPAQAPAPAPAPEPADSTMRLPVVPPAERAERGTNRPAGPMPPAAPMPIPGSAPGGGGAGAPKPDPVQPRRKSPFVALGVAAAVVAMIGTASVLGGVFDGDEAARQESLPETTTSVPDATAEATDAPASPTASASASATASPSASAASASPSASASASPSATGASAAPTASAGMPSPTPSNPTSAPPVDASPPATTAPPAGVAAATLQRGDYGPEVAELQTRLRQAHLFYGSIDSNYTDRVERAVSMYQSIHHIQGDPSGVYGPNTRSALEAATSGESKH
ncbi:peptidoglycan-binding protein [Streptomyces sp. NPDC060184]|uniref:peptidoglycan-binding domain-containing protein n=1 Tax=Streptomyces sp. NPDC060184 TaxID=3347064 RepID=UPI00364D9B74